ncbi:MAG: DegT/DnrJ/EryC1/StrS family aminotransferase [Proteobacteria bacterium]|nr:MAG: DegT/DnrJ/EryC1/StrS family aminotransferase [Pseudomonadota bacterium]
MIPLFSSKVVNASIDLTSPVKRVIDSHWYILGQEVQSFEKEFAEYVGGEGCVSLANGTEAIEIALRSVGVSAGDKVVTVANAGFYSSIAIHNVGATPLYVDIGQDLNMSAYELEKAVSMGPKAIIVTHLYGQLADIESIVAIGKKHGIPVIEDCAQSHGAKRDGTMAGNFGDLACFSFYPTKNLGAIGDGGAIVSKNKIYLENAKVIRQYGWSTKYHVNTPFGRNSRLDEMQAAILREKLPHLDKWNAERRKIASFYNSSFEDLKLTLPVSVSEDYVAHLYVVQTESRDKFRDHLKEYGVSTEVHYPIPDHQQKAFISSVTKFSLENTEKAAGRIVTLPCFPGLTSAEQERVVEATRSFFK